YFIFTGHMEGDNSQAYGLLFLGILAFLPGFYETRVAYYSSRGAPGYTFASIPDY
ncbi:Os11g0132400, partial [Oryza sativa Japonica Group]